SRAASRRRQGRARQGCQRRAAAAAARPTDCGGCRKYGGVASQTSYTGRRFLERRQPMTRATLIKLAIAIVAVYVIQDGIHFNDESQQVIITQFGDPVGKPVTAPGLYFDLPLVQTENSFSKRSLEYQSKPTQVPTRDKRYISVAAFALWRINDPLKFFQRVQNEAGAQARLDEIVA